MLVTVCVTGMLLIVEITTLVTGVGVHVLVPEETGPKIAAVVEVGDGVLELGLELDVGAGLEEDDWVV